MPMTFPLPTFDYKAEQRGGRWYVVCREPENPHELAPVFVNRTTAREIAAHASCGDRFFERIPAVPIGSAYPRDEALVFVPGKGERAKT